MFQLQKTRKKEITMSLPSGSLIILYAITPFPS